MSRRFLFAGVVSAASLLATAACSSSTGHTSVRSAPAVVYSRTTTAPEGPFALGRGQGFDAAGAFLPLMTCDSPHDYSPGLTFHGIPTGTAQLALSMVDLDNHKVHWLQVGIPATAPGAQPHSLTPGARELMNDLGEATYDGPCPPTGQTHRYELTLYALADALPASFGQHTSPSRTLQDLRTAAHTTTSFIAPYTRH